MKILNESSENCSIQNIVKDILLSTNYFTLKASNSKYDIYSDDNGIQLALKQEENGNYKIVINGYTGELEIPKEISIIKGSNKITIDKLISGWIENYYVSEIIPYMNN